MEICLTHRLDVQIAPDYRRFMRSILLLFFLTISVAATTAWAGVSISFCPSQPDCICIDWSTASASFVEVRCEDDNGGWTTDTGGNGTDGSSGSWSGGGGAQSPSDPYPGTILAGELNNVFVRAKTLAIDRLSTQDCCIANKPYRVPADNECAALFQGSPLGLSGYGLLDDYVVVRNGEGVRDSNNSVPCDQGFTVWTSCCNHSPYVFVCNSYQNQPSHLAAALLIHEVLHVAGQFEDASGSAGPNDPPSTAQITEAVREACGL